MAPAAGRRKWPRNCVYSTLLGHGLEHPPCRSPDAIKTWHFLNGGAWHLKVPGTVQPGRRHPCGVAAPRTEGASYFRVPRALRSGAAGSACTRLRQHRRRTDLRLHGQQAMRNAFVAVDTGLLARAQVGRVHVGGARALAREIHVVVTMAVAAFERVVRLHARPLVPGELDA